MRIPNSAQQAKPWRIHELTRGFRLEDVWELPGAGGPDDFPRLVEMIAASDIERNSPAVVRALFAIRWKLGALFGWDAPDDGLGARVPTLRDRMPDDLRAAPQGPVFATLPFQSLYLLDDEWAAEIANRTMHGVMHVGRVPAPDGGFRAWMAVYVQPNGFFGEVYMAAIRPFRRLLVYPVLMRSGARRWMELAGASGAADD